MNDPNAASPEFIAVEAASAKRQAAYDAYVAADEEFARAFYDYKLAQEAAAMTATDDDNLP